MFAHPFPEDSKNMFFFLVESLCKADFYVPGIWKHFPTITVGIEHMLDIW